MNNVRADQDEQMRRLICSFVSYNKNSFIGQAKGFLLKIYDYFLIRLEGSVVECLTQDLGLAGSSLTGGTALCP